MHMRSLVKITLAILIIIAVTAMAASVFYYTKVTGNYNDDTQGYIEEYDYVISLVMPFGDSEYLNMIRSGIYDAAEEFNAAVVFHESDEPAGGLSGAEYVDIARFAGHDAVIVSGMGSETFAGSVDNAVGEGIPVIITGVNDIQSNRNIYVGTNQYEFGTKAAVLAADATKSDGFTNLAVILTGVSDSMEGEDLIDRRIAGITGKMRTLDNMRLVTVEQTSSDIIGAEDITQIILRDYPGVNVIFCMNSRDTLAAAQAVVDRNKVGDVRIIGTDPTVEIMDFIDKGVIYGVIDRKGYEIGRQCIEGIIGIFNGEMQSSYINVQMEIVSGE